MSLVRLSSVTHSFNQNQSITPLTGTSVQNGVQVVVPDQNVTPPGHYMLFILKNGVPSVSKIVRVLPLNTPTSSWPTMYTETPPVNQTTNTGQPFPVSSWAIHRASVNGAGVSTVHFWMYPLPSGSPVFLGAATPEPRQDVANLFGPQFLNSWFRLPPQPQSGTLAAGSYRIDAHAFSGLAGWFNNVVSSTVTIPPSNPIMSVDLPRPRAPCPSRLPSRAGRSITRRSW